MKKRIFSFLLCVVMLLSVLPIGISAANSKITSIGITADLNLYAGISICFDNSKLTADAPDLYSAYFWDYSWICPDGIMLPDTDNPPKYFSGETYTLMLLIVPKDGATGLDTSTAATLPVTINGKAATYNPECKPEISEAPGKEVFAYQIQLQCPWLSSVSLFDVYGDFYPAPGEKPCTKEEISVLDGAPYSIEDLVWYECVDNPESGIAEIMSESDTFTAGSYYYAEITLTPNDGYYFAGQSVWRINGTEEVADTVCSYYESDSAVLYTIDMVAETRHIDTICINNMGDFIVGETAISAVENVTIPAGTHYTLLPNDADTCIVDAATSSYVADNSLFEAGKAYRATFLIQPKNGWYIDSETVWYINGKTENVLVAREGRGYWYVKSAAFDAIKPGHIDTVNIDNLGKFYIGATAISAVEDITVPAGAHYSLKFREDVNVVNSSTGTYLKDGDLLAEGESYFAVLRVVPDEGWTIDEDTVWFINGTKDNVAYVAAETDYWYVYSTASYAITQPHFVMVSIYGYEQPVAGRPAGDFLNLYVTDSGYELTDSYWYCDDEYRRLENTDLFEADKQYSCCAWVKPTSKDCIITNDTIFSLNDGTVEIDFRARLENTLSYYVWTTGMSVLATPIDEVKIYGYEQPVVGRPAGEFLNLYVNDSRYELVDSYWLCDTDAKSMRNTDIFETGKEYSCCAWVKPTGENLITSETVFTWNDGTVEKGISGPKSDGVTYYVWTEKMYAATAATPIDEVKIYGYEQPVAGRPAGDFLNLYVNDSRYELVDSYWLCDTDAKSMRNTDIFETGKEYSCCAWVKPTGESLITSETIFTWNDGTVEKGISGIKTDGVSYYVWTASTKPIEETELVTLSWYLDPADEIPATGVELAPGTVFGLPLEPGKEGYTFGGWYTDRDLTTPYDPTAPINEDTELFPKWIPDDPCEGYTDIDRSSWYHTAADFVIERGLMGSTKTDTLTFEPNTKVSRAMVASILYRMAGAPTVEYKSTFTDVPAGKWFSNAIEWCAQNGLASGKGAGKFDPNGNVTRQELAIFMMKMTEYYGESTTGRADLGDFADANKVPAWAKNAVEWAVYMKLISGKVSDGKTYLAPTDTATRAEFASILMRFVQRAR